MARNLGLDLSLTEFAGVATVKKSDKTSNPVDVGFLCSVAAMLTADSLPDDFQQHGFSRYVHLSTYLPVISVPLFPRWVMLIQRVRRLLMGISDISAVEMADRCGVY